MISGLSAIKTLEALQNQFIKLLYEKALQKKRKEHLQIIRHVNRVWINTRICDPQSVTSGLDLHQDTYLLMFCFLTCFHCRPTGHQRLGIPPDSVPRVHRLASHSGVRLALCERQAHALPAPNLQVHGGPSGGKSLNTFSQGDQAFH